MHSDEYIVSCERTKSQIVVKSFFELNLLSIPEISRCITQNLGNLRVNTRFYVRVLG